MAYNQTHKTTVSNGAVLDLLITGEREGYIKPTIARELGLDMNELRDPAGRTDEGLLIQLWDRIDTDNPHSPAGLVFGTTVNSSAKGLLASWVSQVDTLKEALALFMKNIELMNPSESWILDVTGELATLRFTHKKPKHYPVMAIERSMSGMVTWGRLLSGTRFPMKSVSFSFPAPHYKAKFVEVFGPNIRFGAQQNTLVFHRSLLDADVVSSNALLKQQVAQRANDLLQKLKAHKTLVESIRDMVDDYVCRGGAVTAEQISSKLAMSRQTLHRKLSEEGSSFRAILDASRADYAKQLLIENQKSISAISLELGFKDTSSFYKAFERWYSAGPSECKQKWIKQHS